MKYYFFKTIRDGSRNRLNPLPFQTTSDGSAVIQKLNTQVAAGGMRLREAYPIGTVFCSRTCELSTRAGTPFYMAGDIYPILDGSQDYDRSLPTPSREMLDAWADYRQNAKSEAAQNLFAGQGVNTAPQKLSLLDRLRAEKRYAVPSVDRDGFFVREQDWYLLVRNIVTRTSTMMTGPSGCGKTELIALAAERLGLELSVYNMGTMLDPVSGLLGVHRLVQGYICGKGHVPDCDVYIVETDDPEEELAHYNDHGCEITGVQFRETVACASFSQDEGKLLTVGSDGVVVVRFLDLE